MPRIVLHRDGDTFSDEVPAGSNLVVRAGTRRFPYPHLRYGCTMGRCAKCAAIVISGGEALPEPNWKEKKLLEGRLDQGYRLLCQLWIDTDVELSQHQADLVAPMTVPAPAPAVGSGG